MTKTNDFYFDLKFFKSLIYLSPHLYSRTNYYSIILTLLTLIISISCEVLGYYLGLVPGECYKALMTKDSKTFFAIFWKGSLMYIGKCCLLGALTASGWFLYIVYRSSITKSLHKSYFKNNVSLKVNLNYESDIDNPDQRMTQDVDKMCNQLANSIVPAALICPFVIAYYTYKTYETVGFYGIGAIYLYFVIGTIVNRLLVSPLAKWTGRVERYEGDLRYKHVTIKNNCEQINFYRAQKFENDSSDDFLFRLLKNHYYLSWWRFPNSFWQNFFNYYGGFLSYAIQYIPIFIFNSYEGLSPSELTKVISNNAFVYIYLINSFTRLTDTAYVAGQMAGILQRVSQLLKYMEKLNDDELIIDNINKLSGECGLVMEDVIISKPHGGILVKNLSVSLKDNDSLLITGNSGVGKTSLLRVITNIWKQDSGKILSKYSIKDITVIPQKPYFPAGKLTLLQQLIFPKKLLDFDISITDFESRIFDYLSMFKLEELLERIGSLYTQPNFEYSDLTPGELQRLSIIRGLLTNPKILLLDESTSSISEDMEDILYKYILEKSILFISIGHRKTLKTWHKHILTIYDDGSYIYSDKDTPNLKEF
uniref:ATP-binding cassette sub-family D member 4 (inferred by orthology to a human protein) n=1 Tax=Strongyloides venezuelensis TaxID=75913 RepID=A0A0K0G2I8_STRVS